MQLTAVVTVESALAAGGRSHAGSGVTALEHVANRPIVHHVLDNLRGTGIVRLIIAGDAQALIEVRASVRKYERRFQEVSYAVCNDGVGFRSLADAVVPFVGDSACLLHPADGLLDGPLEYVAPRRDSELEAGSADLVLFMASRVWLGLRAGGETLGTVREDLPSDGRLAEVALFGPGMLARACELVCDAHDLGSVGEEMAASGARVRVRQVDGWHRFRGEGQDLLELNRVALDRLSGMAMTPATALESNRIEGRVHMDPTAQVRNSVIVGPAVIGAGAIVNDAYIGPYTSVGVGARIEGAEVERSIVADGARVIHVGSRLVSSLVGRNARIFREFSLPRALRLWVGDGDEVALC